MTIALINSPLMTEYGLFAHTAIPTEFARKVALERGVVSYIGYSSTAQLLPDLFGVHIAVNRERYRQQPGDIALVIRILMSRDDVRGSELTRQQIEEAGYCFGLIVRIN